MPPISPSSADSVLEPVHRRLRELGAVRPQVKRAGAPTNKVQCLQQPPAREPKPVDAAPIEKAATPAPGQAHQELIHSVSQAFFSIPPALAVDLFSAKRRETLQDTVSLGTQLWLETTFKHQVLRIDWSAFTVAQLESLDALAAYINGRTTSRAVVTKLRQSEWFRAAFTPVLGEVANDMYHVYFCRNNQIRWNAETEKAWKEQDERYRNVRILVNKLVPVLQPGDPGYDSADDDDGSDSDSDECDGDAMDIDTPKTNTHAFGH